jgi:hypothetical protein
MVAKVRRTCRPVWVLAWLTVFSPAGAAAPAEGEPPLPDETALLAAVLENQGKAEDAREAYTYTMTVTDLKRGSDGGVTRGRTRTYDVFHVAGKEFRKLTAEDGRSLKPAKALEEERKVAKAVRDHRARQSRPSGADEGDDDLKPSDVLRLCRLVNPRREEFRGQPAIVYDFEPPPGSKPRGRAESWVSRTGGRVWVDEQARRFLRLEVEVKRALKVAGGLVASVRPGSSLVFEQARINDEVWLPTYAGIEASARFLLLKGVRQHQEVRFGEYRKFSVETREDVRPLKP